MIYTLTLNPSLDCYMSFDSFSIGKTNRATNERIVVGGKGINICKALNKQHIDSVALGFVGGFTGQQIIDELTQLGIDNDFVIVDSLTRFNLKMSTDCVTELNGCGPTIGQEELDKLFKTIDKLDENDILLMSGSILNGCPKNIYALICQRLKTRNVKYVVDTSGQALKEAVEMQPYVVKPNLDELQTLFDVKLNNINEIKEYSLKLKEIAHNDVIVSLGKDGAIFVDDDLKVYHLTCPIETVKNPICAGDNMLASYVSKVINGIDKMDAFKYAIAAASCYCELGRFVSDEEIKTYLSKVQIEEI